MKVLFDHPHPFLLAHGGLQVQIEQTRQGLEKIGVQVEYMRWWDPGQTGDVIHFFGIARPMYLRLAHRRRMPVILTPLLSETCNRPGWRLAIQAAAVRLIRAAPLFRASKDHLPSAAYEACRFLTVGLEAEKNVLVRVFHVEPSKVSVVPLGLSEPYFNAGPGTRKDDYLISTGTITAVKGSVELARLACAAQAPVLFVGRPYDINDEYWREFRNLIDNRWVRYHPHVESEEEMIRLLQAARGFVLFSQFENWSLAASEAVACGLPLLVRDQKWSRERFGAQVEYFEKRENANVQILRRFHEEGPRRSPPVVKLFRWEAVAERLRELYATALSNSR